MSMQIIPALVQTNDHSKKNFLLLACACACALACGGCVPKKRPAFPVSQLAMGRPIVPQPLEVSLTDPPDIPFELGLVPRLMVPRGSPPRPRVAKWSIRAVNVMIWLTGVMAVTLHPLLLRFH